MRIVETDTNAPPDLVAELQQHHQGLTTVTVLRRDGSSHRPFTTIVLQDSDGEAVTHDTSPSVDAAELASRIASLCDAHAAKHGPGWYAVDLVAAKPPRGSAAKARRVSFAAGDLRSSDATADLRESLREERKHNMSLVASLLDLVKACASVTRGAIEGHAAVAERERAMARETADLRLVELDQQARRDRAQMFERLMAPGIDLLRGAMAGQPASAADTRPRLVRLAHELHASFTTEQWSALQTAGVPTGPFARMAAATSEGDVLGSVADVVQMPGDSLRTLYESVLTDTQRGLVLALQNEAVKASAAREQPAEPEQSSAADK